MAFSSSSQANQLMDKLFQNSYSEKQGPTESVLTIMYAFPCFLVDSGGNELSKNLNRIATYLVTHDADYASRDKHKYQLWNNRMLAAGRKIQVAILSTFQHITTVVAS